MNLFGEIDGEMSTTSTVKLECIERITTSTVKLGCIQTFHTVSMADDSALILLWRLEQTTWSHTSPNPFSLKRETDSKEINRMPPSSSLTPTSSAKRARQRANKQKQQKTPPPVHVIDRKRPRSQHSIFHLLFG